jgi:hypothetical protein
MERIGVSKGHSHPREHKGRDELGDEKNLSKGHLHPIKHK